jgi:HEAT repeat protein
MNGKITLITVLTALMSFPAVLTAHPTIFFGTAGVSAGLPGTVVKTAPPVKLSPLSLSSPRSHTANHPVAASPLSRMAVAESALSRQTVGAASSSPPPRVRQHGILSYDYLRRDARKNGILSYDYLTQGPRHRPTRRVVIQRPPTYRYNYYPSYGYYHYYPYYYNTTYVYEPNPPVIINNVEISNTQPVIHIAQETETKQLSQQKNLINAVLRNGADDRKRAARALSFHKNMPSVAVLVDILINDADSNVRAAAAKSLHDIADPAAYETLIRSAAAEPDKDVRKAARLAADHIKSKNDPNRLYVSPQMPPMNEGEPFLGNHLEELRYGSSEIREKAADEMDDYKGTQAVSALINVLVNDPDEDVREEAAKTLGKIGDRMALPFLKWTKYNDTDKSVRETADKALDKIYLTIL